MVRELWTDILPKYLTFINHIIPVLSELRKTFEEVVYMCPECSKKEISNGIKYEEERQLKITDISVFCPKCGYRKKEEDHIKELFKDPKKLIKRIQRIETWTEIHRGSYLERKEEKRIVRKVSTISEFSFMFRSMIYEIMSDYFIKNSGKMRNVDIKDFIIKSFDESIDALNILEYITNTIGDKKSDFKRVKVNFDQKNFKNTYLYRLVKFIEEIVFSRGKNFGENYEKLIKNSPKYYECQRHIIMPHTSYREKVEDPDLFIIPGLTKKLYQIINNITSLFNLEPDYGEYPEKPEYELPMIKKTDVFLPYIESIANEEADSIESIAERFGLRLIYLVPEKEEFLYIAPTHEFIDILINNDFLDKVKQSDGKIRLIPQFSNETLVMHYLALSSHRRGYLSKELINWIAMNFAFIIYRGVLKWKLTDGNIFYELFKDFQTSEKILPFLMKLICFPNYLGIDKMKIRDSPQYRKEIFNFIGAQIDNLKDFIQEIEIFCKNFKITNYTVN